MSKEIKVYELALELGMTDTERLDRSTQPWPTPSASPTSRSGEPSGHLDTAGMGGARN